MEKASLQVKVVQMVEDICKQKLKELLNNLKICVDTQLSKNFNYCDEMGISGIRYAGFLYIIYY